MPAPLEMKRFCHDACNGIVKAVSPDELARKKMIYRLAFYKTKLDNFSKKKPLRTSEDLLSWRRTTRTKILCSNEVYKGNVYGAGLALRDFSDWKKPIKACIEHGLYLGDYVNPLEIEGSGLPAIVTYGTERCKRIRAKSDIPVLAVGPYIEYVDQYLSAEELSIAKEKLGRTLLVFPIHSLRYSEARFDVGSYIGHLKTLKREHSIDTVLVSLHYSDIVRGSACMYEDAGFTVVTNGYSFDANFLRRLKSLIALSDLTTSNAVGTHVGYCAWLGKPHLIYPVVARIPVITDAATVAADERAIASAFSSWTNGLDDEQIAVCTRFWGFDCVRSREYLKEAFGLFEQALICGDSSRYPEDIRKALDAITASSLEGSLVSFSRAGERALA